MNSLQDLPEDIRANLARYTDRYDHIKISFIAKLAGIEVSTLESFLKNFSNHQKILPDIFRHQERKDYIARGYVPYCLTIAILTFYYKKGSFTEEGCKVLNLPIPDHEKQVLETKKPEKRLQIKLAKELKGATEVPTEAGRIDILTSTEVIEVKQISQWKSALGQVLVYGEYYPSHKKRIYLFGVNACHSSFLDVIKKRCEKFNVTVTIDLSFES